MTAPAARSMQRDFATALIEPSLPVPERLKTWNGSDAKARFDVYRNNVVVSLVTALADTFPVVEQLVGPEYFRALAREFVRAEPPTSPVLAQYGAGFSAWLAGFAPVAALPYLADVARLEFARLSAWHASDSEPLSSEAIAAACSRTDALPALRLELAASVAALQSAHPVVSIWSAHQGDDPGSALAALDLTRPESALVLRDGDEVLVLAVDAPTAEFVDALAVGQTLARAASTGADLSASLALLLRHGAIVAAHLDGNKP